MLQVDITQEFYKSEKKRYLNQVPRIARPFISQYFTWLKKLDAGDVMEWMDSKETLKDIVKKRSYSERIGLAGARGFLKAAPNLQARANEAMNMDVARYTLRFENPLVWDVVKAYGPVGMAKLTQAIEDFKELVGLKKPEEEE